MARTGISSLWLLPMLVSVIIGFFLILLPIGMFFSSYFVLELLEIFPGELTTIFWEILNTFVGRMGLLAIGIILIISPRVLIIRKMRGRFENISRLSPKDILMDDKKNYEIPYPKIERIAIIRAWGRGAFGTSKIRILTNEEKHEFYFVRVVGFLGYEGSRERSTLADYENFIRSILPSKTYVS